MKYVMAVRTTVLYYRVLSLVRFSADDGHIRLDFTLCRVKSSHLLCQVCHGVFHFFLPRLVGINRFLDVSYPSGDAELELGIRHLECSKICLLTQSVMFFVFLHCGVLLKLVASRWFCPQFSTMLTTKVMFSVVGL